MADLRTQTSYNLGLRASGLVASLVGMLLVRSVSSVEFTTIAVVLVGAQLASQLDLGVGSVALDSAARGFSADTVRRVIRQQVLATRRLRAVVPVGVGVVTATLVQRLDGFSEPATAFTTLGLQMLVVTAALAFGPYEQAAVGAQSIAPLRRGLAIGCLVSVAAGGIAAASPGLATTLVLVVVFGPITGVRVAGRLSKPGSADDEDADRSKAIDPEVLKTVAARRSHFSRIQVVGLAAFGIDQLVAASFGSRAAFESFTAHSRYFQLAAGLLGAGITALRPSLLRLAEREGMAKMRSASLRSCVVVGVVSSLVAAPMVLGLFPIGLVRAGQDLEYRLIVPMTIWFVLFQLGSLTGQIQAALDDTAFLLRVGTRMAFANLVASVALASILGPIGVVYGSLLTYPLLVLMPSAVRLRRDDAWVAQGSFGR